MTKGRLSMKIQVVLNARGEIVGTGRQASADVQFAIVPGPNQKVREVEVPDDLVRVGPDRLHEALADYLRKPTRKSTK